MELICECQKVDLGERAITIPGRYRNRTKVLGIFIARYLILLV